MEIIYRRATIHDKTELYDLGVLLNTYNLAHDLKENLFWEGWEGDILKETEEELTNKLVSIFIAETDQKVPAGYILVKKCDNCRHYEVDQLFVKEEYRNNKVGNGLMALAIAEAKEAGMPLELEVYKSNEKAINFYQKLGFKEDGLILRLEN